MSDGSKPRLIDVIICDDVRQETSGKLIVIGIYLGNVLVTSFPTTIPSLSFISKWLTRDGSLPAGAYAVVGPDRKSLGTIPSTGFPPGPPLPFAMTINRFQPFTFRAPGTHRFVFTPDGGRRQTLCTFDVGVLNRGIGEPTKRRKAPRSKRAQR